MKAFSLLHPAVLMIYYASILLVAMFVSNPVIELTALLGAILFCCVLTNKKVKLDDLKFYIPLFLLITITNPLFSHNGQTPLFFMNGNAVTLEAIIFGFAIAVMLIAVMLWCKSLNFVFTSDKLIFLFGGIIPKLSLVLTMALRYIPLLKRQSHKIKNAQKAIGLYSSKSYTDRLRSMLRTFSALIGWSLENAVEVSKSMKARGYGVKRRTNYSDYKFKKSDGVVLFIILFLLTIVIISAACGELDFAYYPAVTKLSCSGIAIAAYISFGVLAVLPTLAELEESIRWKYYKSKI